MIMNYEAKYKQTIERAKEELRVCGSQDCDAARQIFRLFPELKDDWMRKAIMSCCLDHNSKYKYLGVTLEEMCAWLEKQGEKLNADEVIGWFVANIIDYEDMIELFKKDFGL